MSIDYRSINILENLDIFATQVVEGFITGLHKSPFHGFSVEFAEHRIYNPGESIKNIDWKLFARTDKMFTKRFEEETNLRCHLVIDSSSSMFFPYNDDLSIDNLDISASTQVVKNIGWRNVNNKKVFLLISSKVRKTLSKK